MTMHHYEPRSPLQAIDPRAFLGLFSDAEQPGNEQRGDEATIVTIRGPLSQYDDWWSDSYEAIRARVGEACQQAAPVVVLRIDSPGGEVAGLFDTARAIRTACKSAGKRLIVHVEGQCSSAAYALATVADRIVASRTASVGSIGVIAARVDETRAMEAAGVKVTLITSGARKADGFPCVPMGEDEAAAFQADIDGLANEFFDLVAIHRGISIESVKALEAASLRGQAAVNAGLVNELGSFEHVLASLGAETGASMDSREKKARDILVEIGEDEECSAGERERARQALLALDGGEEPAEEDTPPDGEEEPPAEEPAAEEPADKPVNEAEGEEDDKAAKKATASLRTVSASTAGALATHGSKLERQVALLMRDREATERQQLIAAHGGVPAGLSKLLASKPLAEVRAILAELPKPRKPKLGDAAATATVAGTRGAGQDKASQLPPKEARAMRLAMGLDKETIGIVDRGNVLMLGAPEPEEVR
jgi:ClpP class serine protease